MENTDKRIMVCVWAFVYQSPCACVTHKMSHSGAVRLSACVKDEKRVLVVFFFHSLFPLCVPAKKQSFHYFKHTLSKRSHLATNKTKVASPSASICGRQKKKPCWDDAEMSIHAPQLRAETNPYLDVNPCIKTGLAVVL